MATAVETRQKKLWFDPSNPPKTPVYIGQRIPIYIVPDDTDQNDLLRGPSWQKTDWVFRVVALRAAQNVDNDGNTIETEVADIEWPNKYIDRDVPINTVYGHCTRIPESMITHFTECTTSEPDPVKMSNQEKLEQLLGVLATLSDQDHRQDAVDINPELLQQILPELSPKAITTLCSAAKKPLPVEELGTESFEESELELINTPEPVKTAFIAKFTTPEPSSKAVEKPVTKPDVARETATKKTSTVSTKKTAAAKKESTPEPSSKAVGKTVTKPEVAKKKTSIVTPKKKVAEKKSSTPEPVKKVTTKKSRKKTEPLTETLVISWCRPPGRGGLKITDLRKKALELGIENSQHLKKSELEMKMLKLIKQ